MAVPQGQSCESEIRTCKDGILSGSYNFNICNVSTNQGCVFGGQSLAHGQKTIAFKNSSVGTGQGCESEVRTCSNGSLSGSYSYSSCVINQPKSCLFAGKTLANKESVTAFSQSSVVSGQSCIQETRVCTDGALSGSYQYSSCAQDKAVSCLFNGLTIVHGQSITAYSSSTVGSNSSCSSETRTCNNGQLSGTFTYSSCSVSAPAVCNFSGKTISDGEGVLAYSSAIVPYGHSCSSQVRTCKDGVLSGTYAYTSCASGSPSSCVFNSQTVASGSSVTAYQLASVPFGQSCQSQTRLCTNGSLSGVYTSPTCFPESPKSCSTAWGETVGHGQVIDGYSTAQVNFGDSCANYRTQATCVNGILSGAVISASCSVSAPTKCVAYKSFPLCNISKVCQNGRNLWLTHGIAYRGVAAWYNIEAPIGGVVTVRRSNLSILEPGLRIANWAETMNLKCNTDGSWSQISHGNCILEEVVADSAYPECTVEIEPNYAG